MTRRIVLDRVPAMKAFISLFVALFISSTAYASGALQIIEAGTQLSRVAPGVGAAVAALQLKPTILGNPNTWSRMQISAEDQIGQVFQRVTAEITSDEPTNLPAVLERLGKADAEEEIFLKLAEAAGFKVVRQIDRPSILSTAGYESWQAYMEDVERDILGATGYQMDENFSKDVEMERGSRIFTAAKEAMQELNAVILRDTGTADIEVVREAVIRSSAIEVLGGLVEKLGLQQIELSRYSEASEVGTGSSQGHEVEERRYGLDEQMALDDTFRTGEHQYQVEESSGEEVVDEVDRMILALEEAREELQIFLSKVPAEVPEENLPDHLLETDDAIFIRQP